MTEFDSLMKLSLKYNVSSKVIKNCNGLVDDQIFQKRELMIPVTSNFVMKETLPLTEEQEKQRIQLQRDSAVRMMREHIYEKIGRQGGDCEAEALFYCSENNYEYIKARDAFNEDLEFEKEEKKKRGSKIMKGQYQRL